MSVNRVRVALALKSVGSLNKVSSELTEEEVLECLRLEAAAQRRQSILDRLISRATRLNEIAYQRKLKETYATR